MSLGTKSVAIVDDDEALLEATSSFLESMGYHTLLFPSGESFLEFPDGANVETLLTDINMPGMSGLELQQIVRVRHPAMKVVMMTALKDESIRRRALAAGARELLIKPVLADDLIRCLEDA